MRFRANPPADFAGLSKSLLGWSEGQADEAEDEAASLLDFCLDGRGGKGGDGATEGNVPGQPTPDGSAPSPEAGVSSDGGDWYDG